MSAAIWYFAYGSNMQSATLRGRRGIEYQRAVAARVPGWRLVLDKPPLLGSGGAFANIVEDPAASVHGVLFEIGAAELEHIELTEGVLIGNYARVIVPALPLHPSDSEILLAHSLSSDRRGHAEPPSSRYMALLIEGAIEHDLPADYIDLLRSLPSQEETEHARAMRQHIDEFMKRR